MPWQICDLMKNKSEFVHQALKIMSGEMPGSIAELSRRYGISRKTGYKWIARFKESGLEGLENRSRAPHHRPNRTPADMEAEVLEVNSNHPSWGGRKLRKRLKNKGVKNPPAASTITEIKRRYGKLDSKLEGQPQSYQRFERPNPNDLWQMDFKGHFALKEGGRCHPLTITDDHSRFNICLKACRQETSEVVKSELIRVFQCYGLPNQILSDNAPAWSSQTRRYAVNKLEAWLIKLGIDPIHGRPYHPQTQGKEERFHRTLKVELINTLVEWDSLQQCDVEFEKWRAIYNEIRPHESLEDDVPISRYQNSSKQFEAGRAEIDIREYYQENDILRKVDHSGEISYLGRRYYVGLGIWKERVAIRPDSETHAVVSYGWKQLGRIDLQGEKGKRYQLESLKQ